MTHLPRLIQDLALILVAAGLASLIFKKLKQPVVLGYLLAGLAVGPHFTLLPTVKELDAVRIWAELGVIVLLFGLGLEFSFRKLSRVGLSASVTAMIEVSTLLAIGFFTGLLLGWSKMDSLFLGGVLSISSTTIIIRAFDELKLKQRGFANLVFGVLVFEDLVAILLLVLLSTVAVTQQLEGGALVTTVAKLGFFIVLWFVTGIFLLPTLLKRIRPHLNDETIVIVSLGLCLFMVLFASSVGFSAALGAFVMGSLLAETPEAERIDQLLRPVKDLFGAIFFVSVGMLINPAVLVEHAGPIVLIVVIFMLGKVSAITAGALFAGRSLRHSLQAGFSLAQIGEFSFIIATLGLTLKVTSDFLYPIAVAVSAITTFTTPYFIRLADPFHSWLEERLPQTWRDSLLRYQASFGRVSTDEGWRELLRSYALRLVVNGVIVIAIFHLAQEAFASSLSANLQASLGVNVPIWFIGTLAAILLSAPFLWAMALSGAKMKPLRELWGELNSRGPLVALEIGRIVVTLVLLSVLVGRTAGLWFGLAAGVVFLTILAFFSMARLSSLHGWFERRFLSNLRAREVEENQTKRPSASLAPWDAHLAELRVEPNGPLVGKSLEEVKARETFGVTIALIQRGNRMMTAPGRADLLLPGDRLSVIGTDEQIQAFSARLSEPPLENEEGEESGYVLTQIELLPGFALDGVAIRASGIREKTRGLVVGIEREGRRILNPDSTLTLANGDILWIVGDSEAIQSFVVEGRLRTSDGESLEAKNQSR